MKYIINTVRMIEVEKNTNIRKQGENQEKNKGIAFKSIKKQLIGRTVAALVSMTLMLFSMILISAAVLTQNTLNITMKQMAENSARSLATEMNIFFTCMEDILVNSVFDEYSTQKSQVRRYMEQKTNQYYCYSSFVTLDGYDYMTGENVSGEEFFVRALTGIKFISTPQVLSTGQVVYILAMPAYYNGELIGVIYMQPDYNYLYGLTTASAVGETGRIYVIDHSDNVIFSEDIFNGITQGASNYANRSKTQQQFEYNAVNSNVISGFGNYTVDNTPWVGGYAGVEGTDGWVLITTAESFEFLSKLPLVIMASILLSMGIMLCSVLYMTRSILGFLTPINLCVERISTLAKGDLTSPVPEINLNNEAGLLAKSTDSIVTSLSELILDERKVLESLAQGNFAVKSENPDCYIGDFAPILLSLNNILDSLNLTMNRIDAASIEVTSGAQHMSESAISLASGASLQATSTEQLSTALEHLSNRVSATSENASHAQELSQRAGGEVRKGDQYMGELMSAMDEITNSSKEIESILKMIEDIAFQTNILGLNAAVEAARAGRVGAGFAVVADEVADLANRSKANAKETALLVQGTLEAVENGRKIANKTAESLQEIVRGVEESISAVHGIALASEEQSREIEKITENMEEISEVIKNTSETSQKGADTSQKLSQQAETLQSLMNQFQLRK